MCYTQQDEHNHDCPHCGQGYEFGGEQDDSVDHQPQTCYDGCGKSFHFVDGEAVKTEEPAPEAPNPEPTSLS